MLFIKLIMSMGMDHLREWNLGEDNLPLPKQCFVYLNQSFGSLLILHIPYSMPQHLSSATPPHWVETYF